MKKIFLFFFIMIIYLTGLAQPGKKPVPQKLPAQSQMDKMMEDAMKGENMSEEEKAEMRKMMKDVIPSLDKVNAATAFYPDFADNKKLVPVKDVVRIKGVPKKSFTNAELVSNTNLLFSKLMTKASAENKTIITKILSKEKSEPALMAAAITFFLQGQRIVAMGLAMKAVLNNPNEIIYQNNLAAILTQSGNSDKAIPYLRKLLQQQPGNSTLNNNMGYAWFYLGEQDSARKYIKAALRRNPANAEARLCGGILNEANGDPVNAEKDYEKSFEEIQTTVAEIMLKNRNVSNSVEKIDYKKMIEKVTSFEYFTKEWSKLPAFENNINAYEKNKGIAEGLNNMLNELYKKLEQLEKEAAKPIDELYKKSDDEFSKTMIKESLEGINMMSKPALYIIAILSNEQKRMMKENTNDYLEILKFIEEKQKIKNAASNNAKCAEYEVKVNEFMQAVNPKLKAHWEKRLEELRVWLNTWCTWRWYITGNTRNTVTAEATNWVHGLLDMYANALRDFKIERPSCRKENEIIIAIADKLSIPYFNCPAIAEIPINMNTIKLTAQAIEASHDNYGMTVKQNKMPNVSISFGLGNSNITEPGLYGNPYIKTSEGSISQSGNSYADNSDEDGLTPIPKIPPFELQSLDKNLLNKKIGEVTKADEIAIINAKLARMMLNKRLKTDCMKVLEGTLEFAEPTTMVMQPGTLEFNGEISVLDPATGKWKDKSAGKIVVGIGELIFEEGPSAGKSIKSNLMKATLSNAIELMEVPGKNIYTLPL